MRDEDDAGRRRQRTTRRTRTRTPDVDNDGQRWVDRSVSKRFSSPQTSNHRTTHDPLQALQ